VDIDKRFEVRNGVLARLDIFICYAGSDMCDKEAGRRSAMCDDGSCYSLRFLGNEFFGVTTIDQRGKRSSSSSEAIATVR
jgi:hypothetical protein